MMNENDFGSEKVLRAINHLYMMQVCICIAALKELRSAELTDKNIILRAIMRDMPDCGICADLTAEDYGVDFWADRAEYVNESTFNLYVTQAEENVLWNIEKKGQKPGRLAVPQQRITVRGNGHSPGYSAGLSDGVECQIGGDGFPERADSRGIVRLRRRAGDDRPGRAFADDIGRFGRDARRG